MTSNVKSAKLNYLRTLNTTAVDNKINKGVRRESEVRSNTAKSATVSNVKAGPVRSEYIDRNEAQIRDYYRRRAEYEKTQQARKSVSAQSTLPFKGVTRPVNPQTKSRDYRIDGSRTKQVFNTAKTPVKDYTVIGRAVSTDAQLRRGIRVDDSQREFEIKRKQYLNMKLYLERKERFESSRAEAEKRHLEAIRSAIIEEHREAAETARQNEAKAHRKEIAGNVFAKVRPIAITLLVVTLIISAVLGIYRNVFVISEITFDAGGIYSPEELLNSSGIEIGDNLYSFSSRIVSNNLIMQYPMIKSFKVVRQVPDRITFTAETEECEFYVNIHGETRYVSRSLRLLTETTASEAKADGAISLKLPQISSAISGSEIEFDESRYANVTKLLISAVLSSELADRIKAIDVRDIYDITLVCDDLYLLKIGSVSDAALKLKIAAAVLRDDMFNGANKATLDLTSTEETGVIIDNQLKFDY